MNYNQKLQLFLLRLQLKIISSLSIKWGAKFAFRVFTTPFRKPKPYKPPIFEKAEEINILVNGFKIYGYRWINNSTKKIVIVHGFESRAFNFDRYVEPLLNKGYEVYAMDAKAHGFSQGKTIILPEYMNMLVELEKKYGPFDGFISHSFGGIAVCLYQEFIKHTYSKLVLIAPATETTTAINFFCSFFKLSEKVKIAIYELIYLRSGLSPDHFSIKRIAPSLKNPILWIHDEDDNITPIKDIKEVLDSKQPNIEFMITRGLGHRKIYKDNKVIKKIIDFI